MTHDDMPDYLAEIDRLRHKYADKLEIYTSLEIDYLDKTYNASIPFFRELPLDYRIGSLHLIPIGEPLTEKNTVCIDGPFDEFQQVVDRHFGGEIRNLVTRYFQTSMEMVETGGFDILGHMDKIYMNGRRCAGFSFDADWFSKPMEDYLHLVAEKGLMVEINTKSMQKKQELYPRVENFKTIRDLHIPVMVNSDCHYPNLVNDGRREAFRLLEENGIRSTVELINGEWQEVAI